MEITHNDRNEYLQEFWYLTLSSVGNFEFQLRMGRGGGAFP